MNEKSKMADVVILSSDEEVEDERETGSLFQDFLAKVEPFVDRTVIVFLSAKFEEVRADVISCSSFRSLLQRKIQVVKSNDAYIHTGEICRVLCKKSGKNPPKPETKCEPATAVKIQLAADECNGDSSETCVTTTAGEFENGNKASSGQVAPMSLPRVQEVDDDIVIVELPSTKEFSAQNSAKQSSSRPTCSAKSKAKTANVKKVASPAKRKRVIRRLEEKMKVVSEQIKILNKAELSLEEMAVSDSTYLKECKLKERFNKIWNKICTLQGKPPNTGRVVEKEVKCPTTGYPAIDEEVVKFMKNRKRFPDIFDVKEVINSANRKHDLRISNPVLNELAEEVFTNIGNRLQRRRKIDFSNNFGCFLTDEYDSEKDPAMHDLELRKKLERNHKKNKHALNKVFRKFVHYDRLKYGRDGLSPFNQSDDEDKRPSHQRKMRKIADSPSSSSATDSELNEDLSQSSQTKEHSGDSDNKKTLPVHRVKSSKNENLLSSDASDFEAVGRILQPSKLEYISDSDQDKSGQETPSSSQPGPLSSATNCSESSDRNSQRTQDEQACDSRSTEESRSLSHSTAEGPEKSDSKSPRSDNDDHCEIGITESKNQAVIMIIDDADDEATCRETQPNTTPCHANDPVSEKGNVKESAESSAVDVEELDSVKQSREVDERTAAAVTNGEVSVEPKAPSHDPKVKASTVVKIASPLKGSVNLRSISLPAELRNGPNRATDRLTEQQKVGNRKRKVDNDFTSYESPLKVFRKSTLKFLQKEEMGSKQVAKSETDLCTSANGHLSCNNNQESQSASKTAEAVDEDLITSRPDKTPKKSLSLKRKHPSKVSDDAPVTVIVLSDDDSD